MCLFYLTYESLSYPVFCLFPSVMHKLETFLVVAEFRQNFPVFGDISLSTLYPAFCPPGLDKFLPNNDRLETLGDTVLKYLCSTDLFLTYSELDEGTLSVMRGRVVSNNNLQQVAVRHDITRYFFFIIV